MKQFIQEKYWDDLFDLGLIIKALDGAWETITGFLFLFLSKATFTHWFYAIFQNELLEDPNDKFLYFLGHTLLNTSNDTKIFAAIYLLTHGVINIFLVIQLYRKKHWAYLLTIGTLIVFIIYQIYRINIYHSLVLTIFTAFDLLLIILIWHEYKHLKKQNSISYTQNKFPPRGEAR